MILDIFSAKELFLEVLKRAKKKYEFRVENFTVMGNHYHLMIQPKKGTSLSDIMRWIMSVFAMSYNRRNNSCGHVWNGRFFSRIIDGIDQFLKIFRYIDENPVDAHLVEDKRAWPFGGLWHRRIGSRAIIDEAPDFVLSEFPEHRFLNA